MSPRRLRILTATCTTDVSIERIEASLGRVTAACGHDLLLLVEGRDTIERQIPTIDLEDASAPDYLNANTRRRLLGELHQAIDDTRWYASIQGEPTDCRAIEEKLILAAVTIDEVLDQYKPHVVLVWNGLLGSAAVMVDRATRAGTPALFCERGALPGSWCADSKGVNAGGSLAIPPLPADMSGMLDSPLTDGQRNATLAELHQTAQAGASAWEQAGLRGPDAWRTELGIGADQSVLFFPMQVDADTNMRFFSPHFSGSLPVLEAVAEAVRSMPGWFLLVKPHPKGAYPPGAIERALGNAGRCVADINLHDALALCSLVVTINSTVACEAVWSGKPVLQLGKGILSSKNIVSEYDPAGSLSEQLASAVQQWEQEPIRRDRGLQFYRYLRRHYLMQADDDSHTHRLMSRIEAIARPDGSGENAIAAKAVCDGYTWLPAQRLLDCIADRKPAPKQVLLVGYGRNARKLLAMIRQHDIGAPMQWAVWDDDPKARSRAMRDGLAVLDVRERREGTLMAVMPKSCGPLVQSLEQLGYKPDSDFITMFPVLPAQ